MLVSGRLIGGGGLGGGASKDAGCMFVCMLSQLTNDNLTAAKNSGIDHNVWVFDSGALQSLKQSLNILKMS